MHCNAMHGNAIAMQFNAIQCNSPTHTITRGRGGPTTLATHTTTRGRGTDNPETLHYTYIYICMYIGVPLITCIYTYIYIYTKQTNQSIATKKKKHFQKSKSQLSKNKNEPSENETRKKAKKNKTTQKKGEKNKNLKKKAYLIASSKTFLRFVCFNAEHSMYRAALISFISACPNVFMYDG